MQMNGTPGGTMQRVAAAKSRIENLTPDQVEREVAGGALLVDLRDTAERTQNGSIPGAVHMPRGMLEFYADPSLPYHRKELQPDRRIVLYCAGGGRSALGADLLREMGYAKVAHLDGGILAWAAAGKPVDKG
jgi:rhodanese-related sulfurtransferase